MGQAGATEALERDRRPRAWVDFGVDDTWAPAPPRRRRSDRADVWVDDGDLFAPRYEDDFDALPSAAQLDPPRPTGRDWETRRADRERATGARRRAEQASPARRSAQEAPPARRSAAGDLDRRRELEGRRDLDGRWDVGRDRGREGAGRPGRDRDLGGWRDLERTADWERRREADRARRAATPARPSALAGSLDDTDADAVAVTVDVGTHPAHAPVASAGPAAPPAPAVGGVPGRRTVTIRGRGAERDLAFPEPGRARRPPVRRHERPGFKPDRTALWALFLGLVLVLVAAASSHAATLPARAALSPARPAAHVVGLTASRPAVRAAHARVIR